MEGSILAQRERVSLSNGMDLRLLSALEILQARREAGERGKKFLTNTRRGIRLVFVDFFWKQGENTMGPVRCHRFSRFFSLRFTARAYFPWKNGAAAAGGDLSGVPC